MPLSHILKKRAKARVLIGGSRFDISDFMCRRKKNSVAMNSNLKLVNVWMVQIIGEKRSGGRDMAMQQCRIDVDI